MAQSSEDEEVKFLVFIICLYPYKIVRQRTSGVGPQVSWLDHI
jgi:hypothetical protein